ncbi:MAG: hypothetical protein AAGK17_04055 [Pseudomonadota bacterium]
MMPALIAIWALAEATLFFIVADVPIMTLGIKVGVRKALLGAGIAAVFAAIGGAVIAHLTATSSLDIQGMMLMVPGINSDLLQQVMLDWELSGPVAMMIGSFSGVPYKLYAFAAGAQGAGWGGLGGFFLASILARLPRFALVALVAGWLGPKLVERFGTRVVWSGFAVCWTAFYLWYWSVMGF